MKLRSFDNFLLQEEQSNAYKKAVELGLQYKGFGHWFDARTGKVTHKTDNGELVPINSPTAELAGNFGGNVNPDNMENRPELAGLPGQGQQPGDGILKAPEPGTEINLMVVTGTQDLMVTIVSLTNHHQRICHLICLLVKPTI